MGEGQFDFDVRQPAAELAHELGQKLGHGLHDREPHGAADRIGQTGLPALQGLGGPLHVFGHGKQLRARGGRHEAFRQAVEQARGEPLLQRAQPAPYGGLRHPQDARGRREIAFPRNGEKNSQVVPILAHDVFGTPPLNKFVCRLCKIGKYTTELFSLNFTSPQR